MVLQRLRHLVMFTPSRFVGPMVSTTFYLPYRVDICYGPERTPSILFYRSLQLGGDVQAPQKTQQPNPKMAISW